MEKERTGVTSEATQAQRDFLATLNGRLLRYGINDLAGKLDNRIKNMPTSKEEATVLIEGALLRIAEQKANKYLKELID